MVILSVQHYGLGQGRKPRSGGANPWNWLACVSLLIVASLGTGGVVSAQVTTDRDDKGVWFIKGPDDAPIQEVYKAVGYAVATDRLWQMELFRRSATGRMAEIFGPGDEGGFLESDILLRTIGYSEEELIDGFDSMDADSQDLAQGYVDGINMRLLEIESNPSLLPFEFVALSFTPEPWTVVQLLAWAVLAQRNFDGEALETGQLDNAALVTRLMALHGEETGYKMFNDLRWTNDPAALSVIDHGSGKSAKSGKSKKGKSGKSAKKGKSTKKGKSAKKGKSTKKGKSAKSEGAKSGKLFKVKGGKREKTSKRDKEKKSSAQKKKHDRRMEVHFKKMEEAASTLSAMWKRAEEALKNVNAKVKGGSYAWVVSGKHTKSGNSVLYAGPQMSWDVPSIIIEGSIQAGGINISGMMIPGFPAFIIGRTPHHAWSSQIGHIHTTDFYIEDQASISFHRNEIIQVAGSEDVELPVYRGRGPVVRSDPQGPIISWKYSGWGYEFGVFDVFSKAYAAANADEFEAAAINLATSQHICFADSEGNIAYWMPGRDLVREPGEWRLPQGLMGDPLEWDAAVVNPLPKDRNTPRGWYGGWNNIASTSSQSGFNSVKRGGFAGHRTHVIYDYFEKTINKGKKLSFNKLRNLALRIATTLDTPDSRVGNPWRYVKYYFELAVRRIGKTPSREAALDMLNSWDGHFVAGGKSEWVDGQERAEAWVLLDLWIQEVHYLTFIDELGVPDGEGSFKLDEPEYVLFNTLLHGLEYPGSLTNSYNWFQNLADPSAPQNADDIIVAALDRVLADNLPPEKFARGYFEYEHPILGLVWKTPLASRSTYAQCVEISSSGPVRIESMFPLGESGNIAYQLTSDSTNPIVPVFDTNFLSMTEYYDGFMHRGFPLFQE